MKPELPKCPKCGSGKVAYHLYGLFPGEEDVKSIELIGYRVEYRGCWDGDSYVYARDTCNHGWD
jgi:hypothetical protein